MESKKYNIVLGIMIFLFIIVVGVGIAWGLGYIGIKANDAETGKENNVIQDNNVVENDNTLSNVANDEKVSEENTNNSSNINTNANTNTSTSEEENHKHITQMGNAGYLVYLCEDNTIDIPRGNGEYIKAIDGNGTILKSKIVFYQDSLRWTGTSSTHIYMFLENGKLYHFGETTNGVSTEYSDTEGKTIKEVKYNSDSKEVTVVFDDNSNIKISDVYSAYDFENKKTLQ